MNFCKIVKTLYENKEVVHTVATWKEIGIRCKILIPKSIFRQLNKLNRYEVIWFNSVL